MKAAISLGIDADGLSIRQMGEWILLGENGHRTGEEQEEGGFAFLERAAR